MASVRRDVLLVRHAKSAWDDSSLADHDRPLAPRGEKALIRLREYLTQAGFLPDVVLCSSSRRTADTLEGIRVALPKRARIELDDELYLADANTMLTRLHDLDAEVRCVMLVGHNPGIEDLASLLAGSGDARMREQVAVKFPTGTLVALSFGGAWTDLGAGVARIDAMFMARPPRP